MKDLSEHINMLYKTIISIQTEEDCKAFLEDLCTFKEVEQMAQRAYAAKLFFEGKTYNEIIAETELSSTTISRVSRAIAHGSGGYRKFIDYNGKGTT
jgi:TrpR-related protein YerC/YecD